MPENQPAPPILDLAPQAIISRRLQKALNFQESILFLPILPSKFDKITGDLSQIGKVVGLKTSPCPRIRLKRIQTAYPLQYASAIALQLAQAPLEAASAAAALQHHLFQSIQSVPAQNPQDQIWHYCLISVDSRGWIYLELSHPGLAIWLEALRSSALGLDLNSTAPIVNRDDVIWDTTLARRSPALSQEQAQKQPLAELKAKLASVDLFKVLYTHARCCSLLNRHQLRMAVPPQWLLDGELRCNQPSEQQLIAEFCDALDYLNSSEQSVLTALKVALRLSQAFEAFHAACPLSWPESAPAAVLEPNLLTVRLGLIAIGQKLLQILLEQRLFVTAPVQL